MEQGKVRRIVSLVLSITVLVMMMVPYAALPTDAATPIQTGSLPMGFEEYDTLAAMKTAGVADFTNQNGSVYSVSTDSQYAQEGSHSLQLTFNSTTTDYSSCFRIHVDGQVQNASGFSFWIYNPGSVKVDGILYAYADSTIYSSSVDVAFAPQMSGYQKITVRFDTFGLLKTDKFNGILSNTVPTKDTIGKFTWLEFRSIYRKAVGETVYMDNFQWIYDKDVVTFDGAGALPSNVTVQGYDNGQTADFANPSVSTDSDTGNALKVDFGTITDEAPEAAQDLDMSKRYIVVSVSLPDTGISGDGLRVWLKNTSASAVGARLRITDAQGNQHRPAGGSYNAPCVNAASHVNNSVMQSMYTDYRAYGSINWYVGSTTPSLTDQSLLRKAQKLEIYIFPRTPNSGGSLLIDSISVINPAQPVTELTGDVSSAVVSSPAGLVGLTKTNGSDGASFKLTNCDFYAAQGYIDIPVNATVSPSLTGYLLLDAAAPRATRLKLSLLDADGAVQGTGYVGLLPSSGTAATVKVPLTDFSLAVPPAGLKLATLRVQPDTGFGNSYNFLKIGESLLLNNIRFAAADPGSNVLQNKDIQPAAVSQPAVIGTIDLVNSYPTKDNGTLYLKRTDSGADSFTVQLTGTDFYNGFNYMTMKIAPGSTFWENRATAYLVFDVKAPRQTALSVNMYDSKWRAVGNLVGIPHAADGGYVTVKIPLYDLFSQNTSLDFSQTTSLRLSVPKAFNSAANFLNPWESLSVRNMKIVSDDPGTGILQNKTFQPAVVPAENDVTTVDASKSQVGADSGSLCLQKTTGDGDLNIKLTDTAFYQSSNRIQLAPNNTAYQSCLSTGYFVFEAKAPRNTMLNLVLSNGSGSVRLKASVGIKNASGGFQTFKVPLADLLQGAAPFDPASLALAYLTVDDNFKQTYNFLYPNEIISFRNMRFISGDALLTAAQNKDLAPLAREPKTPEEIAQEPSRLLFSCSSTWCDLYTDAAAKNYISIATTAITRTQPDFKNFGSYYSITINNIDGYYAKAAPFQFLTGIKVPDNDMTDYLDTATVRFWARAARDTTVNMMLVDGNYQTLNFPVTLKASADGNFTEYRISFKDAYAALLKTNPKVAFDFTSLRQIRLMPVTATPDGFLKSGEHLDIASPEVWTKTPETYDRVKSLSFHFDDGTVQVEAYNKVLPGTTAVKIQNVSASELDSWGVDFGKGTKVALCKTISLFTDAGDQFNPTGLVWVSFKIPSGADLHKLGFYQVYWDGSYDQLRYVVEGDIVSVPTYSVGTFALVEGVNLNLGSGSYSSGNIKTGLTNDADTQSQTISGDSAGVNVNTGDAEGRLPEIAVCLAAVSALAVFSLRRRRLCRKGGGSR